VRIDDAVAITHEGARRADNEDAVLHLDEPIVLAVADGMGGASVGRRAAEIAVETVRGYGPKLSSALRRVGRRRSTHNRLGLTGLLDDLFNSASRVIGEEKIQRSAPGMGTTLVLATIVKNFAYIAHVGNSRAYVFRRGRLVRLTEDHSLAEFRFRRGRISREEYERSPDRHLLYQALGAGVEVEVDVAEVRLLDGDLLLLCSDGLTRAVDEDIIVGQIDGAGAQGTAEALLEAALAAGAEDNVSIAVARLRAEDGDEPVEVLTEAMRQVFLFRDLSETELLVIAPYLEEEVYPKSATIVSEGDPGDSFYVVASGRVRVSRGSTKLVDIKSGGHFGELSLARPTERSATVRAMVPTRLFTLHRDRFQELLRSKPELGAKLSLALLDAVGDRLRDLSDRLAAVEKAVRGDLK